MSASAASIASSSSEDHEILKAFRLWESNGVISSDDVKRVLETAKVPCEDEDVSHVLQCLGSRSNSIRWSEFREAYMLKQSRVHLSRASDPAEEMQAHLSRKKATSGDTLEGVSPFDPNAAFVYQEPNKQ